jgi:hypothetical protein
MLNLILKDDPKGIDQIIDSIQKRLNLGIDIGDATSEIYPRAYKNTKNKRVNKLIPEIYIGNGNYKEMFFDDRIALIAFFIVRDEKEIDSGLIKADFSIIVQANLNKLFPTELDTRKDEELQMMFYNALNNWIYKIDSIETGIENVYREFDVSAVLLDDMSFQHVFRINMTGNYGNCSNTSSLPSCLPAIAQNTNNTFQLSIPSGMAGTIPNTPVTVVDQDGNELVSASLPSAVAGEIEISTSCAPVNVKVYNSDESIDINQNINSGGSFDYAIPNVTITVKDQNNNTLGSDVLPGGTDGQIDVNIAPCENGIVDIKNSLEEILEVVEVASGDTVESLISNSEITVNGTNVASVPATNSVNIYLFDEEDNEINATISTETITIPNTNLTVNGESFKSLPATNDLEIELVDQNDNAITATLADPKIIINIPTFTNPIVNINGTEVGSPASGETLDLVSRYEGGGANVGTWNALLGIWEIPNCPAPTPIPLQGRMPLQTGFTDDGSPERGRNIDVFTLSYNNPFGHDCRFTGKTGGYHDRVDDVYRDINGVVTTKALAFPNDVMYDFDTWNETDGKVLAFYFGNTITRTFAQQATFLAALNIEGWTDWEIINSQELYSLTFGYISSSSLGYKPLQIGASRVGTSTNSGSTYIIRESNGILTTLAKTLTATNIAVRVCTVTGTGSGTTIT